MPFAFMEKGMSKKYKSTGISYIVFFADEPLQ